MADPLLDVRDLQVEFSTFDGTVNALNGVSLTVGEGEALGLVGESGSGKSVLALAVMGFLNHRGARVRGSVRIGDTDVLHAPANVIRRLRGEKVAIVFQDPLSALHPQFTVGHQIAEAYRAHTDASKAVARQRAVELLDRVRIPSSAQRASSYPHELSGGMRQRAMIAMALVCEPKLLIADEPTTALDVTVQAQILDLINDLRTSLNMAVVFITHDLGVAAEVADRIAVMYAGRIVEQGRADDVFAAPEHPYTWGLLASSPRLDRPLGPRLPSITGSPPSPFAIPRGCAFHPRCAYCAHTGGKSLEVVPPLERSGDGHEVACHLTPQQRKEIFNAEVVEQL